MYNIDFTADNKSGENLTHFPAFSRYNCQHNHWRIKHKVVPTEDLSVQDASAMTNGSAVCSGGQESAPSWLNEGGKLNY